MLYDKPTKNHSWIKWLFIFPVIFISLNYGELESRYKNSKVKTIVSPASFTKNEIRISKNSAAPGMHSRMIQQLFHQQARVSGISPDEMNIRFDAPVEIQGILMSVDCWKSTRLVELAAGINQTPAYNAHSDKDMLMHVSFAGDKAGKIDEQAFFPKPFLMTPEDSLNIGAWIQNVSGSEQSVSPEIIVYYTWKEEPVAGKK